MSAGFTLDGLEPTLDSTQATLDGSTGGGLSGAATDTTNATAALNGGVLLAAVAASTTAAAASLTQFASVVLTAPLFTGIGGIFDPGGAPWSNGAPPVGATVFYDPTNGQVLADGSVFSPTTNNFSMVCQWLPSPGVLSERIIVMTAGPVGVASDVTSAQGTLTVAALLTGAAASASAAAGELSTQLLAAAADSTAASATLTPIALALRTAANDVTSAIAALTVAGNLLAAALDTTSASGALTAGAPKLAGTASDVTSSSGALTAQAALAAAASDLTSALGTLTVRALLAVSALSASSAGGSLTVFVPLDGSGSDATTAAGQLNLARALLVSAAADLSSAQATITAQSQFFAAAASSSSAKGAISVNQSPVGSYTVNPAFVVEGHPYGDTTRFFLTPGTTEVITFDFTRDLQDGETLAGIIQVSVICSAGTDADPSAILDGLASFTQSLMEAMQPVSPTSGEVDNDYYVTATCITTNPEKVLSRFVLLSIRE
jgi:hypothetical protein